MALRRIESGPPPFLSLGSLIRRAQAQGADDPRSWRDDFRPQIARLDRDPERRGVRPRRGIDRRGRAHRGRHPALRPARRGRAADEGDPLRRLRLQPERNTFILRLCLLRQMVRAVLLLMVPRYLGWVGGYRVRRHEMELTRYAIDTLDERYGDDITIHGPDNVEVRGGVLSFASPGVRIREDSGSLPHRERCTVSAISESFEPGSKNRSDRTSRPLLRVATDTLMPSASAREHLPRTATRLCRWRPTWPSPTPCSPPEPVCSASWLGPTNGLSDGCATPLAPSDLTGRPRWLPKPARRHVRFPRFFLDVGLGLRLFREVLREPVHLVERGLPV